MSEPAALAVTEPSQVGEARRLASAAAMAAAFPPTGVGRVALVVSEMATNLVKHATDGLLVIRVMDGGGPPGLEVVALDRGPGIDRLEHSRRDGVSTAGTLGGGLGTIARVADEWDLHSSVGRGTVVFARLWRDPVETVVGRAFQAAGVALPARWERACGDAWGEAHRTDETALLVVDGLGHGVEAAGAAAAAIDAFRQHPWLAPAEQLRSLHGALFHTRGAAAAVARLDARAGTVVFAGVGNVSGSVVGPNGTHHAVSSHGIVGHRLHRVREFTYDIGPGSLLILHTDGVSGRLDLDAYPGLAPSHPLLVAATLVRDFRRPADDACVVIVRHAESVEKR
jgi:anti-sigma regulatory factor (Ser/Thr protein kinase)